MEKFKLSDKFINKYKRKKAPFGFNGLGELVYMRTYSRIKEDGKLKRLEQKMMVYFMLIENLRTFMCII